MIFFLVVMFSDPLVTMVGATIFLGKKHSLFIKVIR